MRAFECKLSEKAKSRSHEIFTVEAVKPLTSARGYKADRAPHDKKRTILARIQNFRHDPLIMQIICGFQYELYTTDEQRSALSRNAGCRRFVFNKALELQNERKKNGLSCVRFAAPGL